MNDEMFQKLQKTTTKHFYYFILKIKKSDCNVVTDEPLVVKVQQCFKVNIHHVDQGLI